MPTVRNMNQKQIMSENQKNALVKAYNWIVLQIDQKNYLTLILIAGGVFWVYTYMFPYAKTLLTIGISNATANSIVEADVRALREKIAELESKVNADFNARRTGVLGETHH